MPVVELKLVGELSSQQRKKIAEEFTATLERVAGKPKQYTYVVFEEVARSHWAIAGELLDEE